MKKPDSYTTPLLPGQQFHLYNRGNNSQDVFQTEQDYVCFLEKWRKFVLPVAKTHAYHLLPNHFHALIEIRTGPLSVDSDLDLSLVNKAGTPLWVHQGISNFFNSYSRSCQIKHASNGTLFHKPFKRKLLSDEAQYAQLLAYIHWNAHKHGLSGASLHELEYCSYRELVSGDATWLERDAVFANFSGREGFVRFHEALRDQYSGS